MSMGVTTIETAGPAARKSSSRRPAWLTLRVTVLVVALLAVGAVAAVRVADHLGRPAAGDRYQVTYEGDDGCGWVKARVDGLLLRGLADLSEPRVPAGRGVLVLDRVWDLSSGDGLGASGALTLANGTELSMEGGTDGVVMFTLGCAVRE